MDAKGAGEKPVGTPGLASLLNSISAHTHPGGEPRRTVTKSRGPRGELRGGRGAIASHSPGRIP